MVLRCGRGLARYARSHRPPLENVPVDSIVGFSVPKIKAGRKSHATFKVLSHSKLRVLSLVVTPRSTPESCGANVGCRFDKIEICGVKVYSAYRPSVVQG